MIDFFAPIQQSISFLRLGTKDVFNRYVANVEHAGENIKLQQKIKELEKQISEQSEIEHENTRLRKLLSLKKENSYQEVPAQIVGRDSSNSFQVIRINRGSKSGIKLQSTVVTSRRPCGPYFQVNQQFCRCFNHPGYQ